MKFLILTIIVNFGIVAGGAGTISSDEEEIQKFMADLEQANKKTKWNTSIYKLSGWKMHGHSTGGRPLIYWECGEGNENSTLFMSTIHGDEITPVYYGLRLVSWVQGEPDICKNYHVIVAPIINPDGYLATPTTRTNVNGIDLNRNFPTKDFESSAQQMWKSRFKADKRRNPGTIGGSEVETAFQVWLIDHFKPSKILAVHSPLNFFDYDGPDDTDLKSISAEYVKSCYELRKSVKKSSPSYKFLRFGFFPGSLGNYAGKERGIPTLTLELPTTDAAKARSYFEALKTGTRLLVLHQMKSNPVALPTASK